MHNSQILQLQQYKTSAKECAEYIFDSEWLQTDYQDHVQSGEDPRDHILYHAAVVLNRVSEFDTDIVEYLSNLNNGEDCE